MSKKKPEIWWCLKDMNGILIPHTSANQTVEVKDRIRQNSQGFITWGELKKQGYKIVKIEVRRLSNGFNIAND